MLHLYWLSSGYAERFGRAALVLLLLVCLLAVLFGLNGVVSSTDPNVFIKISSISTLQPSEFNKLLLTTLQYAAFVKEPYYIPIRGNDGLSGGYLIVITRILLYIQTALLVLAVRNQFRR